MTINEQSAPFKRRRDGAKQSQGALRPFQPRNSLVFLEGNSMRTHIFPNPVPLKPGKRPARSLALISMAVGTFLASPVLAQIITTGDVRQHTQTAGAQFNQFDACSSSFVSVNATDVEQRGSIFATPKASNAFINIFQFSFCEPFSFRNVFASVALGDDDFILAGNLDSATLKATLRGFDSLGRTVDVVVDLQWKGANETGVVRTRSRFESESGSGKNKTQSIVVSRPMTATGSVTVEGENFTPRDSSFADVRDDESRNNFTFQQ